MIEGMKQRKGKGIEEVRGLDRRLIAFFGAQVEMVVGGERGRFGQVQRG